jgi:hypothetical protein
MREEDRYIPINFVKDLRTHIAARAASNFGGAPPRSTKSQQRARSHANKQQTNNKQTKTRSVKRFHYLGPPYIAERAMASMISNDHAGGSMLRRCLVFRQRYTISL